MSFFKIRMFSNTSLARFVSVARKLLWLTIILVSCLWSQLAFGSALSDLANSMQPGSWVQLTTTNFNNGAILRPIATGSILEYQDKAVWNPLNNTLMVFGGSHPNGGPGGENRLFAKYSESANTWVNNLPLPTNDHGHNYHHDTLVAATGDFYHRDYYSGLVRNLVTRLKVGLHVARDRDRIR